jgi:hypothetical protein
MSIVSDLLGDVDSILSVRDQIGAALKPVYLVTRTWSGSELGEGTASVTKTQMLPSPRVVEFKHDLRLVEGGFVKAGDILLKMVSKQSYATESLLDGTSNVANVEKLYEVGGILYRPINVREKHVTWTVLLRRLSEN